MSITELSVKKPAAIIMALILVLGLGVMGYMNLGADLLPSTDVPIITVTTTYKGAGVDEIEKNIVKPIEDALSGVNGVDTIRSNAVVGYGVVMVQFTMETDMSQAFLDVQQVLGDISNSLPEDASKPSLKKIDKNAQPVMMLSISGDIPYDELYYQSEHIRGELEKLNGVGNVKVAGAAEKELMIDVDKAVLEYYGIGINTLVGRLTAENISIPAGEIKQEVKTQTIRITGELEDIREIEDLRLPLKNGGTLRLADVAKVSLQYPEPDSHIRLDGNQSIGIFVQKQSDANIVNTTDVIKKRLEELEKELPKGASITIAKDESSFINSTLDEVKRNIFEGIITTSIVMFLFLRKWRSSLIVLVSIPSSLIATFFMMYIMGFTLNMMTLLGLSLCIGILVDDSIVVLENIQRHLRMGKGPIQAALDGRKEIGMAAIAITLCDVVVFGPVAFMSGMIGSFFKEFRLTVVAATLFSLLVSFTLTPMLASRLLKKDGEEEEEHKKPGFMSKWMDKLGDGYQKILIWALDNRLKVIAFVTAGVIGTGMLIPLKVIDTEFIPNADQSQLTASFSLASGTNLEQTDNKVKQTEEYLKTLPEVDAFLSTIGSDDDKASAQILIKLVDKNHRRKSQNQIAQEIREWGKRLEGVDFAILEPSLVGNTSADGAKPIALNIRGKDTTVLADLSYQVEKIVKGVPGITDISNTSRNVIDEIHVDIDHLAAAECGVTSADISNTLRTAINGTNAGVFRSNGDEYDIRVRFDSNEIETIDDLGSILIVGSSGQSVRLNQVAAIHMSDGPEAQKRQDRQNMATISANIEGRVLGSVNKDIRAQLKTLDMPEGYSISFGGDQKNMAESFESLIKALVASLILVFMILVVLYESYLTPFIRMLSLPCGIIGALAALAITGNSLNIVSMIGLIMLDGLASKNGTLLIDYTNTLMKKGVPLREALLEAGKTRLKPIMMTTITMIVGMFPAAIAMSEGSEIKSGMAITIIGGMITSTLLSPILLPVVYTLLDDVKRRFSKNPKQVQIALEGK